MTRRLRLLYPFLFAILPILNVLTRNPGGSAVPDVASLIAVLLAGCALAYGLVALASRRGWRDPVVPLLVTVGIVWFYGYPALRNLNQSARSTPAPKLVTGLVIMALALLTFLAVRWVARRPAFLDRLTSFFALTGVFLVIWSGVRIAADQLRARASVRNSRLAHDLRESVNHRPAAGAAQPRRDIYLIILDEYANSSVTRERFGFDNRQFEDSLRQLGFVIPKLMRSNYVHTLLSLPSLLNFSHLTRLQDELGPGSTDPTLPDYLVENNRTAALLKTYGYQFLFFPSQWWISTAHNRNADWEFQAWDGFDPAREMTRSDLRRAFIGTTPLALLHRNDAYDAEHVHRTLDALAGVPERSEATFALAHILNPHYPNVFDAECRVYPTRPTAGWERGRAKAYTDQIHCLNRLLLQTVNTILRQSSPAPIILLVGDHGSNSLRYSEAPTAEAVSPAQARERFGAFGAFFLPEGGSRVLADSVTLVNVLPRVLNHYFHAGLLLSPDKVYMSLERTPYRLVEVDQTTLSP